MGKLSRIFRPSSEKSGSAYEHDGSLSSCPTISAEPASSMASHKSDVIITFQIGHEVKEYQVPRARLCAESEFFRNYFTPEGPNMGVTVFKYQWEAFRHWNVITHWLNTETLPHEWDRAGYEEGRVVMNVAFLCKTVLHFGFRRMLNTIMDATRHLLVTNKTYPVLPSQLEFTRRWGMEDTPLFRFGLDVLVYDLMTHPRTWQVEDEHKKREIQDMWKDQRLTNAIMQHVLKWQLEDWVDPRTTTDCRYHDHTEGYTEWVVAPTAAPVANQQPNTAAHVAHHVAAEHQRTVNNAAAAMMNQQIATNAAAAAAMSQQTTAAAAAASMNYSTNLYTPPPPPPLSFFC